MLTCSGDQIVSSHVKNNTTRRNWNRHLELWLQLNGMVNIWVNSKMFPVNVLRVLAAVRSKCVMKISPPWHVSPGDRIAQPIVPSGPAAVNVLCFGKSCGCTPSVCLCTARRLDLLDQLEGHSRCT